MTFGECLKAWREYRKVSEIDLSHQAQVTLRFWQVLQNMDRGEYLYLGEVYRIAKTLGVTVEQLCEGIGPTQEVACDEDHSQL